MLSAVVNGGRLVVPYLVEGNAQPSKDLDLDAPYRVIGVRGPSFGRWGGVWMSASAWWRIQEGDRVIATTWPVATHIMRRCIARGVTAHVVFHGSDLTRPPQDEAGFHRVCREATHRWTVSRFLQRELADRGYDAEVLPSPIALDVPKRQDVPSPDRWLYVARATPLKGGDRFLRLVKS